MGHLSPCAFSSSPHCMQTHMCPHRYTTDVMLASEQMTQFPELTTVALAATGRKKVLHHYQTCIYNLTSRYGGHGAEGW